MNWKSWVSNLSTKWRRNKKLLKDKYYRVRQRLQTFVSERDLVNKSKTLLGTIINVVITGLLVEYAVEHRNFVSYGLMVALGTFYFKWIVKTIKGQEFNVYWLGVDEGQSELKGSEYRNERD